jgi:hypothetical protein
MIHSVLRFLAGQLNVYIDHLNETNPVPSPVVILQSPNADENKLKELNNLLLFLVNISEESSMKNLPDYRIINDNTVTYKNPALNLNIFVVISAFMANYENELRYLAHSITYFQGKTIFTQNDVANMTDGLPDDFRICVDLYSLTFEQINYIWSTLGGKQHPFVCYKIRILEIERESVAETRGVIRQIRIDEAPGT